MGFLGSLVRYFDGRERESVPARLDDTDARNGLLGAGLTFKGEVRGEGDLFIAGSFEANISAGTIVIAGAVRGNVSVTTHVEMLPSGTLTGTVRSSSLAAAEGASLRGEVWLGRPA